MPTCRRTNEAEMPSASANPDQAVAGVLREGETVGFIGLQAVGVEKRDSNFQLR